VRQTGQQQGYIYKDGRLARAWCARARVQHSLAMLYCGRREKYCLPLLPTSTRLTLRPMEVSSR
jgi:hypothetical protein